MPDDLQSKFDEAMMNIYRRAIDEAGYKATRFFQMLHDHRGLGTAQILIDSPTVSEGYTALWERKRLDLTVESLVLQPEWQQLFTDEQLRIARERLLEYGFVQ
jgi:hypothetical protein